MLDASCSRLHVFHLKAPWEGKGTGEGMARRMLIFILCFISSIINLSTEMMQEYGSTAKLLSDFGILNQVCVT